MNHAWTLMQTESDDPIALLRAALVIAADEYPDLDIAGYEAQVAQMARTFSAAFTARHSQLARIQALNSYLFEEYGFSGNQADYYDPRNSYINDVLERRLGIPISLAVIQIAVARASGIDLEGVSFPGHFLVRLPVDDGLIVLDPYQRGRSIDADELRQRAQPHMGNRPVEDDLLGEMLAPASQRQIVQRMLRNLLGVYRQQQDWERALRCSDRLLSIDANDLASLRERGLLYLEVGHVGGARNDLLHYLAKAPDVGEHQAIRAALVERGMAPSRLN